jgi:uncharacterized protein YndB with AHSA1/START domain
VSHDLKLERSFDAAPEVVFDAFIDPQAQKELYADAPDWIVEAECDLRVGAGGRSRSGLRDPRRLARPTCSRWSTGRGGWSTARR